MSAPRACRRLGALDRGVGLARPEPWCGHSAADLAADIHERVWNPEDEAPVVPAAVAWSKGSERMSLVQAGRIHALRATLPGETSTIARSGRILIETSHRYEWILVGTRPANVRFVVLDRLTSRSPEG